MSKHNNPVLQDLKSRTKSQLKKKLTFKRVSCHAMIAPWSSNELLAATPKPCIYFPDYDYFRDYDDDFKNFTRVINLTGENSYLFYKCKEKEDSKNRGMMVIFAASKYEEFYSKLQKLDKLKVFL